MALGLDQLGEEVDVVVVGVVAAWVVWEIAVVAVVMI